MRLVELSRSEHANLRVRADLAATSAARQHLIPIVVSEFRKAATQYPIVFAKHPETGRFAPHVLTGLGIGENLFWSGTELEVTYVPLNVRRQPFYVGLNDAPGVPATSVLCIDLDHACLDAAGEQRIVDCDGSDSAYLRGILSILGEWVAGKAPTEQFIETALSLNLLTPIMLNIVLDDGTPLRVEGLYGLDEDNFKRLDEREIAGLWRSGRLDLIYTVLVAAGQIFRLIQLKNQRIALGRAWHGNAR